MIEAFSQELKFWTLLSQCSGTKPHHYFSLAVKYHVLPLATCYLLSGYTEGGAASKRAFSAYLDDLISQAVTNPNLISASIPSISPWQFLPDTPTMQSTALAFQGALLAVGGGSLSILERPVIYIYQPSSNSWVEAGELPTKRWGSGCITLPSEELLVVGGDHGVTRQTIEIASILYSKFRDFG